MRWAGIKTIAAATLLAAFGMGGTAQAASPCPAVPTTYDSGGVPLTTAPNDPLYPHQWGLAQVKAPAAWSRGALGAGATIAIVDSGVDLNHPDLQANLVPGVDLVSNETCSPGAQDLNGHGTHVAGIAAAVTGNGIGVAGTAPAAKIMPVRVLGADGSGASTDVATGIEWAADHGAQVINLSLADSFSVGKLPALAAPVDLSNIASAVDYAYGKGAVVVAAAGNDSFPFCDYPALSKNAVCVAANDSSGFPSFFSNFPARTDGGVAVRAPGGDGSGCGDGDIWSTYWPAAPSPDTDSCGPRGYEPLAGTSMATPFVSGIAAMLRGAGLSNSQVMDCLRNTSSNGGSYDSVHGYGNVNADAAVAGCAKLPIGGIQTGGSTGQSTTQPGTGTTTQPGQQGVQGEQVASDSTAPRIRVSLPASAKAHAARAGFALVRVSLNEAATVQLKIMNGRETAVAGRNAFVLARGTFKLRPGITTVKVPLTRMGRRVLRSRGRTTATVLASARDAAGNDGTAIAEGKIRR